MDKPTVSVIIPVYNAEKHLAECLDSVLVQTWNHWEIILVDDGSTDKSFEIASSYCSPKVKVVRQQNSGASSARNHGLRHAQGDYIQYLDADDLLSPQKIENQLLLLKSHDNKCIASCAWGRFVGQPLNAVFKPDELWSDLDPVDFLIRKYNNHSMMQPGVWLTPRAIIEKAGMWNETLSLNDDGEYFSRVILNASGIVFTPAAYVYYRTGYGSNLSSSKGPEAIRSLIRSVDLCAEQLLAVTNNQEAKRAVANMYQEVIYTIYPDYPKETEILQNNIEKLGGSDRNYHSTPTINLIRNILGWKVAKKLHLFKAKNNLNR